VWAFEELVSRVEAAGQRATGADEPRDGEMVKELLRLYAGHFIEKECEDPWAVSMRDRLRAKFVRAVTTLGSRLEQRGRWEQAVALYSRALELDNLAEGLYRHLMISYRELGETAEALQVYRRCRDMLSIVLSINPSADTEAIRATLR
jgi:LuxR family transcriptional regulator, maltose regulon positive regulatory protein